MKHVALILPLALAACRQQSIGVGANNSSTATVTPENNTVTTPIATATRTPPTAASLGLQPGKWETRIEMVDRKVAGLPPGTNIPMEDARTVTSCMTPEQASKGPGEMLKQAKTSCTSTTNTFAGGKIALVMTCKLRNGAVAIKTVGTYTPTEVTTDSEAVMTGRISSREKTHAVARRIGDCG